MGKAGLSPRSVTLVLCTRDGAVLGSLPPFDVELPWWQETADVVAGAAGRHGVDVQVLRLLGPSEGPAAGGPVTYLAEVTGRAGGSWTGALRPWTGTHTDVEDPLRLPYARPGGPARDLGWADAQLRALGTPRTGPAVQQRTWNLSSIWRLPTDSGAAWLKVVPPFFAHEGRMLRLLGQDDPEVVPALLATQGPRVLMADVPGGDHYDAGLSVLLRLVRTLVGVQRRWVSRLPELGSLGVPDWRGPALAVAAADVLSRTADQLDPQSVAVLDGLVAGLGERMTEVAGCGIPDTLVHGDFHPGNACGPQDRPVILDWGDCGIGHPLLDQAAFTARLQGPDRTRVLVEWSQLWTKAVPGSDPLRAAGLLAPVAALRQAVVYRSFLDRIEASERVYHADDPAARLRRAAELAGGG